MRYVYTNLKTIEYYDLWVYPSKYRQTDSRKPTL
jgi:hypothetical protein